MPQYKLIYGSIIFSTVLLSIILRLVHANPLQYNDMEDEEKSRDKRSFYDIQCKGIYDKTIFARVDQICEDCYNIFREPKLHSLCRERCYNNRYFQGCLTTMLLNGETEEINQLVDFLGRKK